MAAEKIVKYLKGLRSHQGLLFASHRIDECISTCDRVLMLVAGRLYFDGSVHAFDELATHFYQVDLVLSPITRGSLLELKILELKLGTETKADKCSPQSFNSSDSSNNVDSDNGNVPNSYGDSSSCGSNDSTPGDLSPARRIIRIIGLKGGGLNFERVVEYSPTLVRLTFEKRLVSLTEVWSILGSLKKEGLLERYSFRVMGMEEALATIIASSKGL
jgi:hypothetical protein